MPSKSASNHVFCLSRTQKILLIVRASRRGGVPVFRRPILKPTRCSKVSLALYKRLSYTDVMFVMRIPIVLLAEDTETWISLTCRDSAKDKDAESPFRPAGKLLESESTYHSEWIIHHHLDPTKIFPLRKVPVVRTTELLKIGSPSSSMIPLVSV